MEYHDQSEVSSFFSGAGVFHTYMHRHSMARTEKPNACFCAFSIALNTNEYKCLYSSDSYAYLTIQWAIIITYLKVYVFLIVKCFCFSKGTGPCCLSFNTFWSIVFIPTRLYNHSIWSHCLHIFFSGLFLCQLWKSTGFKWNLQCNCSSYSLHRYGPLNVKMQFNQITHKAWF